MPRSKGVTIGPNFPILQMFAFVIQVAIHINSQWDADCIISLETQVLQQLKILEPEWVIPLKTSWIA